MVNLSVAIEALTNLRNEGFKIHVDDFGTHQRAQTVWIPSNDL